MVSLKGDLIYLRALEPEDLDFVFEIENNMEFWELSDSQTPYSRHLIKQYLQNAQQDIFQAKQLRLAICMPKGRVIGLIDIFDFDPKNKRAGIGILIHMNKDRSKGYGREALKIVTSYCFNTLHLHQLYANVDANNTVSLKLFEGQDFIQVGCKKDWRFDGNHYHDEILLQRINK